MARASQRARVLVELEVGARLRGQASSLTWVSRVMSLCLARVEDGLPVRAMI